MENGVYFKQSRKMFLILMKDGMAFRDEWFLSKQEYHGHVYFLSSCWLMNRLSHGRNNSSWNATSSFRSRGPKRPFMELVKKIFLFPLPSSPGWCSRHWVTPCLCLPFTTPTDLLIHLSRGHPPPFILMNSPSPQRRSQCLFPKPAANHRSGDYSNFCCLFVDNRPFVVG